MPLLLTNGDEHEAVVRGNGDEEAETAIDVDDGGHNIRNKCNN